MQPGVRHHPFWGSTIVSAGSAAARDAVAGVGAGAGAAAFAAGVGAGAGAVAFAAGVGAGTDAGAGAGAFAAAGDASLRRPLSGTIGVLGALPAAALDAGIRPLRGTGGALGLGFWGEVAGAGCLGGKYSPFARASSRCRSAAAAAAESPGLDGGCADLALAFGFGPGKRTVMISPALYPPGSVISTVRPSLHTNRNLSPACLPGGITMSCCIMPRGAAGAEPLFGAGVRTDEGCAPGPGPRSLILLPPFGAAEEHNSRSPSSAASRARTSAADVPG